MPTTPSKRQRGPMGPRWTAVLLALLTACAGGVDLLSVVVLGGVFSGVVTGDLIHVGHGLGTAAWGAAGTAAAAVAGFGVGVGIWARMVAPPEGGPARRVTGALFAEVAVLAAFTAGWVLVAGRPGSAPVQISLLVTSAVAMGGQSALARTLGGPTTYLTGTFTAAMAALATGGPASAVLNPLVRPVCLLLGAVAATLVLGTLPWAAALVPLTCAVAALLWRCSRPRRRE